MQNPKPDPKSLAQLTSTTLNFHTVLLNKIRKFESKLRTLSGFNKATNLTDGYKQIKKKKNLNVRASKWLNNCLKY